MKFGGGWSAEDPSEEHQHDSHDVEQGLNLVLDQDDATQESADNLGVGDQLYCKVHELQPEFADRITGMLLECDNEKIVLMLNSESYLEEMVSKAVDVLQDESSSDVSYSESEEDDDETREQLGEALYERVEELEPELCGQITGMLLEMDENTIRQLLQSRDSLEEAVAKARTEYLLHSAGTGSSSSEDDEISCELFNLVAAKCPENADKITGMMLELDQNVIEKLLDNPKDLDATIERARAALHDGCIV